MRHKYFLEFVISGASSWLGAWLAMRFANYIAPAIKKGMTGYRKVTK